MFREMRRWKQAMPEADCIRALEKGTSGVLAVAGDDGYPYAVPLAYVYHGGRIYFHCAAAGHKMDALARDPKASFCVVDTDQVVPEKFATHFRSVIAFGRAAVLEDETEKRQALEWLADKYSPGQPGREQEIGRLFRPVRVVALTIEHLSGKESMEFVKQRPAPGEEQ